MADTPSSDERRRLVDEVESDLESQDDVTDYRVRKSDQTGVLVEIETDDDARLYRVTLEQLPNAAEETQWNYIGPRKGEQ